MTFPCDSLTIITQSLLFVKHFFKTFLNFFKCFLSAQKAVFYSRSVTQLVYNISIYALSQHYAKIFDNFLFWIIHIIFCEFVTYFTSRTPLSPPLLLFACFIAGYHILYKYETRNL